MTGVFHRMASESLSIPEEHLAEVCEVLRLGLRHHPKVSPSVRTHLLEWVMETEAYVNEGDDEEDEPKEASPEP